MAIPETFAAISTKNEYPEEFQTLSFGPFASAAVTGATTPLCIIPRSCDIEQITLWMTTKPGQACTAGFVVAPSGTAIASGTAINTAANCDLNAVTNATTYQTTLNSSALNIAAGSVLGVTMGTATSLVGLIITVRFKNRNYRTDDAGHKHWKEGGAAT